MANARIRPRRGTATQWATVNPTLAEGEIGIEFPDTGIGTGLVKIKFGDGEKAWNDLPYGFDVDLIAEAIGTVRYNNDTGYIQILIDGVWTDWEIVKAEGRYLFNAGDEFNAETGGFVKYNGGGTIANDGTELDIVGVTNTTSGETSYFGTNNIIDLSGINSIEVVFSADLTKGSYCAFSFGISNTKGGEFVAVNNYVWNNKYTNETAIFDVSSIDSGYFQIMEKSGYPTTASISSIKLLG